MAGAEVRPGQRATIYTDAGAVITVVAAPDGGAPVVTLHSTGLPGQKDAADGAPVVHSRIGCARSCLASLAQGGSTLQPGALALPHAGSHRHLLHNLIGLDRTGSRRGFTHTHHANGSYSLMEGNIATGIWF